MHKGIQNKSCIESSLTSYTKVHIEEVLLLNQGGGIGWGGLKLQSVNKLCMYL